MLFSKKFYKETIRSQIMYIMKSIDINLLDQIVWLIWILNK